MSEFVTLGSIIEVPGGAKEFGLDGWTMPYWREMKATDIRATKPLSFFEAIDECAGISEPSSTSILSQLKKKFGMPPFSS